MYKIKPSKYQEILKNKITDNYKIDYKNTIDQINKDTCSFASKLHIDDRLGNLKRKILTLYLRTINLILRINCNPDWLIPQKHS